MIHRVPASPRLVFETTLNVEDIFAAYMAVIDATLLDQPTGSESYVAPRSGPDGAPIVSNVAFFSHQQLHRTHPGVAKIAACVENVCTEFARTMYDIELAFTTYQCSAIRYSPGGYLSSHTHFPHTFVGTVYLDVREGAAPVIFGDDYVVQPRTGMCLISPGDLPHRVPYSPSARTVLTLDMRPVLPILENA